MSHKAPVVHTLTVCGCVCESLLSIISDASVPMREGWGKGAAECKHSLSLGLWEQQSIQTFCLWSLFILSPVCTCKWMSIWNNWPTLPSGVACDSLLPVYSSLRCPWKPSIYRKIRKPGEPWWGLLLFTADIHFGRHSIEWVHKHQLAWSLCWHARLMWLLWRW